LFISDAFLTIDETGSRSQNDICEKFRL